MTKLAPYFKAIVAALIAGASAAIPQVDDGLTASECLGVAVAFLTALSVVFAVPNRDPEAEHQDESVQPAEFGHVLVSRALVAAAVVTFLVCAYLMTRGVPDPQAILGKAILGKA